MDSHSVVCRGEAEVGVGVTGTTGCGGAQGSTPWQVCQGRGRGWRQQTGARAPLGDAGIWDRAELGASFVSAAEFAVRAPPLTKVG